ncbi:hypothetical protein ABIA85_006669 [Bradyrhizobium sp. LA6.10]|uniref:hypothetical protein n=1 Tax=Bradyrhizobium sp. LA6.10 TaxID=3156318 RepID=UPI00339AD054
MRNPFKKLSEADKRVATLRADLDAARAQLAAIDAGKIAAQIDSAAFAKWSADRSAAALEVDRQSSLVETHETEVETARRADADAAARREIEAARKAATDLAERIRKDGQRIAAELLELAKDAAKQSLAAKALNNRLPEGETPIPAADILARDFDAEPRKDIRSRGVDLWVAETTGAIIGDQDAVASDDGVRGQVHIFGGSMRWKCIKRRFHEIEFHPSGVADWPGNLFSLIRLPRLDGPGFLFDGAIGTPETVADLDVAAAVAPRKKQLRPVQIELIPVDPSWPPANVVGQADQNAGL